NISSIVLHVAAPDAAPQKAHVPRAGGDSVNGAIDDPRVENLRKKTRHRGERAHDEKVIKLVNVILIEQQSIKTASGQRRKPLGQSHAAAVRNVGEQNTQSNDSERDQR